VIALGDHGFERQKLTMGQKADRQPEPWLCAKRGSGDRSGREKERASDAETEKNRQKRFGKYPKNTGSWP